MPHHLGHRQRRSPRLKGYDYSRAGAYFVTICTKNRECLFGEIIDNTMHLNPYGEIVATVWEGLPRHYPHITLDAFVIMPNHVHGIVMLGEEGSVRESVSEGLKPSPTEDYGNHQKPKKQHGLPEIIRAFKTFAARKINKQRNTPGLSVWHRSYYDHIIRSDRALERIRRYITLNPTLWPLDSENPAVMDGCKR